MTKTSGLVYHRMLKKKKVKKNMVTIRSLPCLLMTGCFYDVDYYGMGIGMGHDRTHLICLLIFV